jgi:hypothetical protein
MPLTPEKIPQLNRPAKPHQPLYERVQDWIFKIDSGFGVQWLRVGLFLLFVGLLILAYTGKQFYGLHDPDVMNLGQLGRNLAEGRGYVTKNLRPVDIAFMNSIGQPVLATNQTTMAELWTPPVYPLVLSVFFRFFPPEVNLTPIEINLKLPPHQLPPGGEETSVQKLQTLYGAAHEMALDMDRILVKIAWLFFLLGMGVLYFLARELFDHRVAVLSVFLYVLCDPLLSACVAGSMLPFLALIFMLSAYALVKATQWSETDASIYWVAGALAATGFFIGVGSLARYAFLCTLVPLIVYLCLALPRVNWVVKLGVPLAMLVLVWLPWLGRNYVVCGNPLGLAPMTATDVQASNSGEFASELQMQRRVELSPEIRWRKMGLRTILNWNDLYREGFKDTGANYLIAFFLVALLHRFKREDVFRLQRYVFWSMIMAVVWLGFGGPSKRSFFTVFQPLVTIYGAAFFFVMFERLQFRTRWIRRAMVGLFVTLNILPLLFSFVTPAAAPYPPYEPGVIATIAPTFDNGDLIATDIPWAMAWYGNQSAILLVEDQDNYIKISDNVHHISAIYMTQETFMESRLVDMLTQPFWLNKYSRPDPQLGLPYFRPLTPDGQQVLLSDRTH